LAAFALIASARKQVAKQSNEAFFWMLFSAGGVVAALLIPVQLFLFGVAIPLGWVPAPTYEHLVSLLRMPLARIYLFILCSLPLFHWAHRFRFTLYDGLQVKHLNELIFTLCYGGAIVGSAIAAYLLWSVP
jgi:succinate dehydrogenase subunit D